MHEWTKVVTNPLGLGGFALFLVFGYLARAKRSDERRWLTPTAIALAVVALMGGLLIAYKQIPKPTPQPIQTIQAQPPAKQQTNSNVQQTSTGEGSPNVQGVQGDVTITIDQSKSKTETKTPPGRKPAEKKHEQASQ
jgi:hypothetical protein